MEGESSAGCVAGPVVCDSRLWQCECLQMGYARRHGGIVPIGLHYVL